MGPEWRWKGVDKLHREHGTVLTLMSSQLSKQQASKISRPVLLSHGTVSNTFTDTGGVQVTKCRPNAELVAVVEVGGLL